MNNVHDGHRGRLKERYVEYGLDSFSELHVLELLLFFCIPRGDVNPLAHRLLERFGSLAGVMDASEQELMSVKGVGSNTAMFLRLIPQFSRRYLISRNEKGAILDTADKSGEFIVPYYFGVEEERIYLISLDARLRVLSVDMVSGGDVSSAQISVRKLVACAIDKKAVNVILAHNHPSGALHPSDEDAAVTRQVRTAMKMMGIEMVDHIIVANNEYSSMALGGYFK